MRRHPLLDEAKAELDVTYEEVRRAETKLLVRGEEAPGDPAASRKRAMARVERGLAALAQAHELQRAATSRFAVMSGAFATAAACAEPVEAARLMLIRVFSGGRPFEAAERREALAELETFARTFQTFMRGSPDLEAERAVRAAWEAIDTRLREHRSAA